MSKKTTKPEEKGFLDKVKETVGGIWSGTKDKAEDLKEAATSTLVDLKDKVAPEKPKTAKVPAAKKPTQPKSEASAAKVKATAVKARPDAKSEIKTTAKKKVTELKPKTDNKPTAATSKKSTKQ